MKKYEGRLARLTAFALALAAVVIFPGAALAHCDTVDGPVVADAKTALEKGDVTPVLKWVKAESEEEVRDVFAAASAVRKAGGDAKELADRYFYETVVRLHRAGEGAAYTGLKPAGTDAGPAVKAADDALARDSDAALVKTVTDAVAAGIRARFAAAEEAKKDKDESVTSGRAYTEAYVDFVHYVERVYQDATAARGHAGVKESNTAEERH